MPVPSYVPEISGCTASLRGDPHAVVGTTPLSPAHAEAVPSKDEGGPCANQMVAAAPLSTLRKSVAALGTANIVYGGCQWLIVVILARTCPTVEVGRFARGLAICGPVMMCTGLQLRTLLATDSAGEFALADYVRARLLMLALAAGGIFVICFWVGYAPADVLVISLVAAVKAVEGTGNLIYGYFQKTDNILRIAKSMLMKGPAMAAGAAVGGAITHNASGAVLGLLAGIGLLSLAYDFPVCLRLIRSTKHSRQPAMKPCANDNAYRTETTNDSAGLSGQRGAGSRHAVARLIRKGMSPGVVVGLNSLNVNVPRYFVDGWLGASSLGVFAALASLMRIGSYLELALVQSTQSRLARLIRNGEFERFQRLLLKTIALVAVVGVTMIALVLAAGEWILATAYGEPFAAYAQPLVTLVFAGAIGQLAGILKGATDASRNYVQQIPIFLVSLVVAVLAGWLLVPRYGLQGAALAVVAAKLSLLIGYLSILTLAIRRLRAATRNQPSPIRQAVQI